jgi:hypothetical protein
MNRLEARTVHLPLAVRTDVQTWLDQIEMQAEQIDLSLGRFNISSEQRSVIREIKANTAQIGKLVKRTRLALLLRCDDEGDDAA